MEVNLYSIEARFNEARTEYMAIMEDVKTSCLGKEKMSKKCQKAAELNADMQTYLLQMSNLYKPIKDLPKQQELLSISDQLTYDKDTWLTDKETLQDLQVSSSMNYHKTIAWTIGAITVIVLLSRK